MPRPPSTGTQAQPDTYTVLRLQHRVTAALDDLADMSFHETAGRLPAVLDLLLPGVRLTTAYGHGHGAPPAPFGTFTGGTGRPLTYEHTYLGPPEPLHFRAYGFSDDPEDQLTAALFFGRLGPLLKARGSREVLARQARRDWLTGLPLRVRLEVALAERTSRSAPSALLALRLPEEPGAEEAARLWEFREFAHSLRLSLTEDDTAYLTDEGIILVHCRERELPRLENLAQRLLPDVQMAYALSGEAKGRELVNLACARLDGWRSGPAATPAPWAEQAEFPLTLVCRVPVIRSLLEQKTAGWHFSRPLTLLADFPAGQALRELPDVKGPVLVLTDSVAVPYLSDVIDLAPAGLMAGSNGADLEAQLRRVAAGEQVYVGPLLEPLPLFPRERQIWRLIAFGHGNAEIARLLGISGRTATNYYSSLREKLQLPTRHAVALHYWSYRDES